MIPLLDHGGIALARPHRWHSVNGTDVNLEWDLRIIYLDYHRVAVRRHGDTLDTIQEETEVLSNDPVDEVDITLW